MELREQHPAAQDGAKSVSAKVVADWGIAEIEPRWEQEEARRLYFLELQYRDVFGRSERQQLLRCWFEPSDFGEWKIFGHLGVESQL